MSALIDTPGAATCARRRNYTLFLLTALSAVSFMDRQILAVMIEPVKAEFALIDLQVGIACRALRLAYDARDRRARLAAAGRARAAHGARAAA